MLQMKLLEGCSSMLSAWRLILALLLLLAALLTGGLVAVHKLAALEQDRHLSQAESFARIVLPVVNDPIKDATVPANDLAQLLSHMPGPALFTNQTLLPTIVGAITSSVTPGLIQALVLLYAGRPVFTYPAVGPELSALLSQLEMLHPGPLFPASVRDETLFGMTSHDLVASDVLANKLPDGLKPKVRLIPVFAGASSAADTWGWPANMSASECSTGQLPCYDAATKQKWWGQVMVVFNHTAWLAPSIRALEDSGYGYRLKSVLNNTQGTSRPTSYELASSTSFNYCQSPVVAASLQFSDARSWELSVCITNGWHVSWRAPVIAAIVVAAVLLVAVLSVAAHKWHAHSQLIQSLLPEDVLQTLTLSELKQQSFLTGTPADKLVTILSMLLEDKKPHASDVVQLLTAIKRRVNLYTPACIARALHQAAGMDAEVMASLAQTLVDATSMPPCSVTDQDKTALVAAISSPPLSTKLPLLPSKSHDAGMCDMQVALTTILGLEECQGEAQAAQVDRVSSAVVEDWTLYDSKIELVPIEGNEPLTTATWPGAVISGPAKGSPAMPAPRSLLTKLEEVLSGAVNLDGTFNAWQLADAAQGKPLSALGYWVFDQSGLMQEFNIAPTTLLNFLHRIELGYKDNPYHNRTHAADVLQSVHAMLHQGGMRGPYADSLSVMGCYLAAIAHDFEHQGVTNDYLVNTRHALAVRYNDKSPHENHHVAAAYKLLSDPKCNFLSHIPMADWLRLRKLVIDLILGTDMKQHFAMVGQWNSVHQMASSSAATVAPAPAISSTRPSPVVKALSTLKTAKSVNAASDVESQQCSVGTPRKSVDMPRMSSRNNMVRINTIPSSMFPSRTEGAGSRAELATGRPLSGLSELSRTAMEGPEPLDAQEQLLALQMMMKCSDLGHVCAALPIHLTWVKALEEELFRQGDLEKSQGLTCSPLCDRAGQGITKSQVGFLEVVVLPLLNCFTSRFVATKPLLTSATANYNHWKQAAMLDNKY